MSIVQGYVKESGCNGIPTNGLIASYNLAGTASDSVGNFNGSENSMSYIYDSNKGVVGNFDGISRYITINSNNIFDGTSILCYSVWCYIPSITAEPKIIVSKITTQYGWELSIDTNVYSNLWNNGISFSRINYTFLLNNWYNFTIIIDNINKIQKMYVNGIFYSSSSFVGYSLPTTNVNTYIGRRSDSSTNYLFNGYISNIHFYNRVLSDREILQIYNSERGLHNTLDYGLLANYEFNNTSNDSSVNQYDASYTSATFSYDSKLGRNVSNFNGSQRIQIPLVIPPNSTTYSISVWYNSSVSNTTQVIWSQDDSCGTIQYIRIDSNNVITYGTCTLPSYWTTVSTTDYYSTNKWYNIIVSVSNNICSLYVNGVLKNSGTVYTTTSTQVVSNIGIETNLGANGYFNGKISNLKMYNRPLSQQEITTIYEIEKPLASKIYCTSIINKVDPFNDNSGLALYKLDGDVLDSSNNYNGTNTNTTFVNGLFGKCGYFNGSNTYINLPIINYLKTYCTRKISISFWMKPITLNPYADIFGWHTGSISDGNFVAQCNNTNIIDFTFVDVNNVIHEGNTSTIPLNIWTHIVISIDIDSQYLKLYNNGVLVYTSTTGIANIKYPSLFYIGQGYSLSSRVFNGYIDQFRIFNRAITQQEVKILYKELK